MTKTGILCVVLVMFSGTAGMLYGKDAGAADDWNRLTASPSYGFNAALFPLTYGPDDTETALFMPGVELRHFNGINVTRWESMGIAGDSGMESAERVSAWKLALASWQAGVP